MMLMMHYVDINIKADNDIKAGKGVASVTNG